MASSTNSGQNVHSNCDDSITTLCQEAQKILLQATKASNNFPLDEYEYFNSFREFTKLMGKNCKHISSL